jgi:hypothetical protein
VLDHGACEKADVIGVQVAGRKKGCEGVLAAPHIRKGFKHFCVAACQTGRLRKSVVIE